MLPVGRQEVEKPHHLAPALLGVGLLLFAQLVHPVKGQRGEGELAFVQRHVLLAEPVDQQGHRSLQVAVVQQRFDHAGISLGRAELLHVFAPEGHVAGGAAGPVPGGQRGGHLIGRLGRLASRKRRHLLHAGGGKLVPPCGQSVQAAGSLLLQLLPVGHGRFAFQAGQQAEEPFEQIDQLVDAKVVHGAIGRVKQRELPAEPQHVPGVHQRSALDGPMQQVFALLQQPPGPVQLPLVQSQLGRSEQGVQLTSHPGGGRADAFPLPPTGFRVAHAAEQPGQERPFQLFGPFLH